MRQTKKWLAVLLSATLTLSVTAVTAQVKAASAFSGEYFGMGFDKYESAIMEKADGWSNGDMFDCTWRGSNVSFNNGIMTLKIDKDAQTGGYSGAELRSRDYFGYGMYDVKMKPIKNDGVVSSFFTYTGPSDGTVWDEIDIEFLGKDTTKVQFNYFTKGQGNHEFLCDLGFDASLSFHQYGFYWAKDYITWYVDGKAVHTATRDIPSTPGKIMMNVWNGTGVDNWLNHYNGKTPLTAQYDWASYTKEGAKSPYEPTQPSTQQPSTQAPQPSTQAPTQNPQQNSGTLSDGYYYIKGVGSQKYLTVDNNRGSNAQNVIISSGTGVDGQVWKLTNTSNGYFTLTSKLGNFGLDIGNASADNGANVQIYQSHGGDAQQFIVKPSYQNGAYMIATKCTNGNKVLDVEGRRTNDGTNVCQYTNNGQTNQMWIFEPVQNQSYNPQPTQAPQQPTQSPQPSTQAPQQPTQAPTQVPQSSTGKLSVATTINNWGSGYQVSFKVENKSGARVNTWTITIPKSQLNITTGWNVNIKESGSEYVITPVEWNSTIENGNSVEFGIQGAGSIGNSISCTIK